MKQIFELTVKNAKERTNKRMKIKIKNISYILIISCLMIVVTYLINRFWVYELTSVSIALNIMAGSLNGKFSKKITGKLEVMSILLNNQCNLMCKHCYLQTREYGKYLAYDEWEKFFYSVFNVTKPGNVCFAGKEVFVSSDSVNVLYNAVKIRNESQINDPEKTEIGVITNGTLLTRFKNTLNGNWPDYFDISMDGLPEFHDKIRGAGAFKRLEPNLLWLIDNFNGNIWITHTAFPENIDALPEFIKFNYENFGLTRFSIGLYKDKSYTDQSIKLKKEDVSKLFNETIKKLSDIKSNEQIRLILEMDHTQNEIIPILIEAGWIKSNEPLSPNTYKLNNNITLDINVAFLPVGLWRSVRISPEGFWLAAEDLTEVDNYDKLAVANVRDFDFNTIKLYHEGLNSERFEELYKCNKNTFTKLIHKNYEQNILD